jgi:RNAse (barnase) inhibitor barstar
MKSQTAKIQTKRITNWDSFHSVFAEAMGFPSFYGKNMNAWIDCMSYLDGGMTKFTVAPNELFHLEMIGIKDFAQRLPEIFHAFIECSAFVNQRHVEAGKQPLLALVLL